MNNVLRILEEFNYNLESICEEVLSQRDKISELESDVREQQEQVDSMSNTISHLESDLDDARSALSQATEVQEETGEEQTS